ncbi:MAG: lipopolysaccharide biosynthesis protein [Terriglobales bacterium]
MRLGAIASALSLAGTLATQLVVPRVLLSRWGDGGYALYVVVTGLVSYLILADAGVQLYLVQRMTALRSTGKDADAAHLAAGGLRTLTVLALAGLLILCVVFLALLPRVMVTANGRAGSSWGIMIAFLVQATGCAFNLATGGWSTAVEQATGHYARTHLFGFTRIMSTTAVLLVAALWGAGTGIALGAAACPGFLLDAGRFASALRLSPMSKPGVPFKQVMKASRGSLAMMTATATQMGLYPALAATLSAGAASVAVPGRTVSNGARFLSTAIQNVVWAPVATRMAAEPDAGRAYAFWKRNSPILGLTQLAGTAALVVAAPHVVPHWLPSKSASIVALIPIYAAEQALLIACLPSQVLLQATGRFSRIGATMVASALLALGLMLTTIGRFGAVGFAWATLVATATCTLPGLLTGELLYWREQGQPLAPLIAPRLGFTAMAVVSGVLLAFSSVAASSVVMAALAACVWHAWSARAGGKVSVPA